MWTLHPLIKSECRSQLGRRGYCPSRKVFKPPPVRATRAGKVLVPLIVLFLDGDTMLERGFPAAALRVLESDSRIASAWGHRRESRPEHSLYNRVLDLDWIYAQELRSTAAETPYESERPGRGWGI